MIRTPLLWVLVVMLFVGLVIQLAQWNQANETTHNLAQTQTAQIRERHQKWRDKVDALENERQRLETQLLYREPNQLLPELTKVAAHGKVSLVGVETPSETHRQGYRSVPINMTFSGSYAGFTALLAVVEGIQPTPRIDAMRIYRRKRQEGIWLSLTLSMMTRADAGVWLQTPAIEKVTRTRNPFDTLNVDVPPQPSRDKQTALPQLIGILWDENNPLVILKHDGNRHTVPVGTVIAETTVVDIKPNSVTFQRNKKRYQQYIFTTKNAQIR